MVLLANRLQDLIILVTDGHAWNTMASEYPRGLESVKFLHVQQVPKKFSASAATDLSDLIPACKSLTRLRFDSQMKLGFQDPLSMNWLPNLKALACPFQVLEYFREQCSIEALTLFPSYPPSKLCASWIVQNGALFSGLATLTLSTITMPMAEVFQALKSSCWSLSTLTVSMYRVLGSNVRIESSRAFLCLLMKKNRLKR
jgi:hypothetical protein